MAWHHSDCWEERSGCAACSEGVRADRIAPPVAPSPVPLPPRPMPVAPPVTSSPVPPHPAPLAPAYGRVPAIRVSERRVANRDESAAAPSFVRLEERPREVLREQMAQRGLKVARNRKLCSGLLRDLCPEVEFRPHVHVLVAAFDAGIPSELLAAVEGSALTGKLLRGRLVGRLQTDQALNPVLATWVVEAWERAIAAGRAASSSPVPPRPVPLPQAYGSVPAIRVRERLPSSVQQPHQTRVEFAAYLGSPRFRGFLGEATPCLAPEFHPWLGGLGAYSDAAPLRAALAATQFALRQWEDNDPGDYATRRVAQAVAEWLEQRTPSSEARIREYCTASGLSPGGPGLQQIEKAVRHLVLATGVRGDDVSGQLKEAASCIEEIRQVLPGHDLRRVIAHALIVWAIEGDEIQFALDRNLPRIAPTGSSSNPYGYQVPSMPPALPYAAPVRPPTHTTSPLGGSVGVNGSWVKGHYRKGKWIAPHARRSHSRRRR
jgi:hypothetical protein